MSAIDPAKLGAAFVAFMRQRHAPDAVLAPRRGVTAMLDFYAQQRVDTQSDMLLFEWGTHDWGQGPSFEIGITRQVERPFEGEDDDDGEHDPADDLELWQLRLTFHLPPSKELAAFKAGTRWCESLDELAAFREWLFGTAPFQRLADEDGMTVKLGYECAE